MAVIESPHICRLKRGVVTKCVSRCVAVVAVSLSAASANASDWGSLSCQHWMNTKDAASKGIGSVSSYSESAMLHWASGYVAGLTDANGSYADVDASKLTKWLEGYCLNRPRDSISAAARAFVASVLRSSK